MDHIQFANLKPGDLVRHTHGSATFKVKSHQGGVVTVVREMRIEKPEDWNLVDRHGRVIRP
jgi:hypothetical protein